MINIINKRAECTQSGCGAFVCNAEITIEENGKLLYIHANSFDETIYTVAEKSIYDKMTLRSDDKEIVEFLEEYDDFEDTQESKYAKYFKLVDKMLEEL